jgi:hypothetical protein
MSEGLKFGKSTRTLLRSASTSTGTYSHVARGHAPTARQPSPHARPLRVPPSRLQIHRTWGGAPLLQATPPQTATPLPPSPIRSALQNGEWKRRCWASTKNLLLCRNQLELSHIHQTDASSCLSCLKFEVSAKSKRLLPTRRQLNSSRTCKR